MHFERFSAGAELEKKVASSMPTSASREHGRIWKVSVCLGHAISGCETEMLPPNVTGLWCWLFFAQAAAAAHLGPAGSVVEFCLGYVSFRSA